MHNVFHVSQLRKYVHDPSHIISYDQLEVRENGTYIKQPLRIVDYQVKQLRRKEIPMVKIQREKHREAEATWEMEEDMHHQFPWLFDQQ